MVVAKLGQVAHLYKLVMKVAVAILVEAGKTQLLSASCVFLWSLAGVAERKLEVERLTQAGLLPLPLLERDHQALPTSDNRLKVALVVVSWAFEQAKVHKAIQVQPSDHIALDQAIAVSCG